MSWQQWLSVCVLVVLSASANAKKLVLDPDNPEHWQEFRIGEIFATDVVADMTVTVRVPEPYHWLRSGTYRRIGWKKDLKQIQRKDKPKIRYGYFMTRTTTSFTYDGDRRVFEKGEDGEMLSAYEYFESLGATDLTLTPVEIDDHDVLLVEGMLEEGLLRMILIAENIGSSTIQIRFVCNHGACRDPSPLAWNVFRRSLLIND